MKLNRDNVWRTKLSISTKKTLQKINNNDYPITLYTQHGINLKLDTCDDYLVKIEYFCVLM